MARNASSTAVIGLPTSVTAMLARTCGASVGAGSGNASTQIASAPVTAADKAAASQRVEAPGRCARAVDSVLRSLTAALISSTPVSPPPMAASVSATSMPCNCNQTSVSSKP